MHKAQAQVLEFHREFNAEIREEPSLFGYPSQLRVELIQEELDEFAEALADGDIVEAIDALGDLLYVVYGAGIAMGVDLEPFVDEIHASNMSKAGGGVRPDGKILKGPNYRPPDIAGVLRRIYGDVE